jgi:hypothetical protein
VARATWKAPSTERHGKLNAADTNALPESAFAFPKTRKEPLNDASHVRNAIARFDQVKGVSDADREVAFANLRAAAKHFGVAMEETNWRQLGAQPHTKNPAQKAAGKKTAASKKTATKKTAVKKTAGPKKTASKKAAAKKK